MRGFISGKGSRYTEDGPFGLAVARGLTGVGIEHNHKFGRNATLSNSRETFWTGSTLYTYLGAATAILVSSSSGNDDLSSTGAEKVMVYGLDANYAEISEEVTLDGQNEQTTSAEFLRVYRMVVTQAGSTGANEGVVYAGTGAVSGGVPANVYARIEIGVGQTQMAMVTVPAGYDAYITSLYAGVAAADNCSVELAVRPFGEAFQTKFNFEIYQNHFHHVFEFPLKVEQKGDIEVRGTNATGAGIGSAGFEYILVARQLNEAQGV
jgi:hypothetical protein